jgi:hypothetical protein
MTAAVNRFSSVCEAHYALQLFDFGQFIQNNRLLGQCLPPSAKDFVKLENYQ